MTRLLSAVLADFGPGMVAFWCPGCQSNHPLRVGEGSGPAWGYNGNPDAPTFTPSVLVTYNGADAGDGAAPPTVCHSFVTDGQVQFLADSTHRLAGQAVALPSYPRRTS